MATVIPRSYIENYSNSLNGISESAKAALVTALSKVDYSQPVADVRNAVIAIMQVACGASTDVAARLAAEFYNGLRLRMVGETVDVVSDSMRNPDATDGAIRAFVQLIVDGGDTDAFIKMCADRIDYETRRAANECVAANAKRDPKKPRWARIPTGAETCQFCIMLASRGFVYHSEETASHAHAHCDCRIVPSWDKSQLVQGYDPDKYYDMWKHPEKYKDESIDDVVSNQGVSFDLAGVKNSANTEKVINKLKSEYNSPLQTVSLFPPQIALERNRDGQVDLFTGTVMFLKRGDDVITTHEFAHTLWSTKRMEEYKIDNSAAFEKELRKLWRAYRKDQSSNAQISSYSRENIDEFLAEGFSAYKTGRSADNFGSSGKSPYAKAIGELVDKYFKKK